MKFQEKANILKFADNLYPLMNINRYNVMPKIINETVAAHSFQVAIISLKIYDTLKDRHKINLNKVLIMSLVHDISESILSDIPYTAKRRFKELKVLIDKLENEVCSELLDNDEYVKYFKEYTKKKSIEALIVRLADTMSANVYASEEIKLGNSNFERVLIDTVRDIDKYIKQIKELEK